MNRTEQRRLNLERLALRYGSQRKLSDVTGLAPAYISQMLNGVRGIGERTARKIEESTGLDDGWMDREHYDPPPGDAVNFETASALPQQTLPSDIDELALLASPRTQDVLRRIAQAARDGRLTDADLDLLHLIAERLAGSAEEKEPGIYDRLRKKAHEAHRDTD